MNLNLLNVSAFLIPLLLFISCNIDSDENLLKNIPDGYEAKIIFLEEDNLGLWENILALNLDDKTINTVMNKIREEHDPRVFPNLIQIMFNPEEHSSTGYYIKYNTLNKKKDSISLYDKLYVDGFIRAGEFGYDFVMDYRIFDEDEILLSFRNKIYLYDLPKDDLKPLFELKDKKIIDIKYNLNDKYVLFTFQHGFDDFKETFLGIFDLENKSTLLTEYPTYKIQDYFNNKILFSNYKFEEIFYNLNTKEISPAGWNNVSKKITESYFIDDDHFLLIIVEENEEDFFIFNSEDNELKRITDSNLSKQVINIYRTPK